jgi:hypothetical protein
MQVQVQVVDHQKEGIIMIVEEEEIVVKVQEVEEMVEEITVVVIETKRN